MNLQSKPFSCTREGRVSAFCQARSCRIQNSCRWKIARKPLPGPQKVSPPFSRVQHSRSTLVHCSSDDRDKKGASSRRPSSNPPNPWTTQLSKLLNLKQPLRLILNVLTLFFLMRLWPLSGRNPVGEPQSVVLQVPYSEFVQQVRRNEVLAVSVDGQSVAYTLRQKSEALKGLPSGSEPVRVAYTSTRPADFAQPYDLMLKNGVTFSAVSKQGNRLVTFLIYGLYGMLLLSALSRLPLKLPHRGAGRLHKGDAEANPITFDDVAGVDEAKEELSEIVELLKSPEKFSKLGARAPSGVLLVGPPGTGKTLLAKAVAGEADVPFFSISASEFVELYVGMGAMRVRELFASARREAPSIVFIDEIDAVAKGRDTRLRSMGNDEREQTLNQLLTELDGFDSDADKVVICIAATNRPDVLDSALLRPGRFDRRVSVERPDRQGRQEILKVHIERKSLPLGDDVTVESIASATTGFTGADLANLVNEAALLAGRDSKTTVGMEDFDRAVLRAVAGIEKKRSILIGIEKTVVARHEVGHALVSTAVARLIPGSNDVAKLSIIPRSGGALGFTYIPLKTEDRALMFFSELRGQLAMLMGGRAAEEISCGQISTGAADDIRRATELAYRAVSEFGLSTAVGPISVATLAAGGGDGGSVLLKDSGKMGQMVENEVRQMLETALNVAKDVVVTNKKTHDELSRMLESSEKLEGTNLTEWLEKVKVPNSLRDFVLKGSNF